MRIALICTGNRSIAQLVNALKGFVNMFVYLPKNISPIESTQSILNSFRIWNGYVYPLQLFQRISKDNIDLAHINFDSFTFGTLLSTLMLIPFLLMLRLKRTKVVTTFHVVLIADRAFMKQIRIPYWPVVMFYKTLAKLSNKIIVHSDVFASHLSKLNIRSISVPYGIPNVKVGSYHNPIKIVSFGIVHPRRGLEILLEAISQTNICVIIPVYVRVQKFFDKLLSIVRELGISDRVEFKRVILEKENYKSIEDAEIAVFPFSSSIAWSETLATAIAMEKVVVASDTEFFRCELQDGVNAILFKEGSSTDLANTLEFLVQDSMIRKSLRENAKKLKKSHGWNIVARRILQVYNEA